MVSRYINNANGNTLVIEAAYILTPSTFGGGSGTTSCTRNYARNYDDDGTKVCNIQRRTLSWTEIEIYVKFPIISIGLWCWSHPCQKNGRPRKSSSKYFPTGECYYSIFFSWSNISNFTKGNCFYIRILLLIICFQIIFQL